jgi:uncharacterized iron-regulated membrane protein
MRERDTPVIAFAVASTPVVFGIVVAVATATPDLLWPIIGLLIWVALVRSIVLWMNRRDDPRFAKPPSDPPVSNAG